VDVPLPWERLLWSARPLRLIARLGGERFLLTDFRLVHIVGRHVHELIFHDIGDVQRTETTLDRILGTSTIVVHPHRHGVAPIVMAGVRSGASLAALLELLAGDPHAKTDTASVQAALAWNPQQPVPAYREAIGALAAVAIAIFAIVAGLHGKTTPIAYAADDAIEPDGVKRPREEIVRFMETEVMPWARQALGRLKGGADRVTCDTCHGRDADARHWQMPSVFALPLPDVRDRGWETYNGVMDAQMRNAIYGYVAESDNQAKAAYMREIVMPGMAHLLRRPAYDFTRTYEYNRSRRALGCYHCHRVK
jgi:hypothetical protein